MPGMCILRVCVVSAFLLLHASSENSTTEQPNSTSSLQTITTTPAPTSSPNSSSSSTSKSTSSTTATNTTVTSSVSSTNSTLPSITTTAPHQTTTKTETTAASTTGSRTTSPTTQAPPSSATTTVTPSASGAPAITNNTSNATSAQTTSANTTVAPSTTGAPTTINKTSTITTQVQTTSGNVFISSSPIPSTTDNTTKSATILSTPTTPSSSPESTTNTNKPDITSIGSTHPLSENTTTSVPTTPTTSHNITPASDSPTTRLMSKSTTSASDIPTTPLMSQSTTPASDSPTTSVTSHSTTHAGGGGTQTTPDPCLSLHCSNNGNCTTSTNGSAFCQCKQGYSGSNCSTNIDECESEPCKNEGNCTDGVNQYTCTCVVGFNGTDCEHNIDECIGIDCKNGGTCQDGINNYTCKCMKEWEGRHCEIDVDECAENTHKCDRNAKCADTDGGYNCTCNLGFTGDGRNCNDINECTNDTLCQNGATCFNSPGNYICICTDYWNGTHCEKDVDECGMSPSKCAGDADCKNTPGGYNCTCKDGYRGSGLTKCFKETLIQVTPSNLLSGDDDVTGPVPINDVIYYFGKPYNSFYVSMNGYITLGNYLNQRYPPSDETAWEVFNFPIIAPLWSDIVTQAPDSGVSYAVTTDKQTLELIGNATGTPRPSVGIIVTWQKAVPYPFSQNSGHEMATFQAIISKVGVKTFVMFNYDQEFFTWKSGIDRFVAVGFSKSNFQGDVKFGKENFIGLNKNGSGEVNGRWVFNVTSTKAEWEKESACLDAVSNLKPKLDTARSLVDYCPCSLSQIQKDRRFKADKTSPDGPQYVSRFKRGSLGARQRCHYSSVGSLLKGYPGGGYIEVDTVEKTYSSCCEDSKHCALFYNLNPSDTCAEYNPPTWSPSWGDPHITTLDGARYTFNARGEFILLSLNQQDTLVNVQVRTALAKENNTDATVFVGLAAQVGKASKVELLLNRTSKTCSVYVNGSIERTVGTSIVNITVGEMEIYSDETDNKTIIMTFKSGLSIQVNISEILDIVASASTDGVFKGNTVGLLGNNNGNASDDYRPRNDTNNPIKNNSAEADLFHKFGLTWRVKVNESLFSYNVTGETYAFFNNDSIKPNKFISDEISEDRAELYLNETCGYGIINVTSCGDNTACLVDAAATCNQEFGQRSKITQNHAEKEKEVLDHMPPKFALPNPLFVGFNENSTEFIFMNFNVTVNTTIPTNAYHKNTTYFSWNVTDYLKNSAVFLKITATDDMNATSEYWPDIYYCGCLKGTECDYSLIVQDGPVTGSEGKLFRARCECSEGMTGEFCDAALDRCIGTSCYEGVVCNKSIPAPANPCGSCPPGLSGDGFRCYDVNECYEGLANCNQTCTNTNGSYSCSCTSGYELDDDGHSCKDINECETEKAGCNDTQYCENTIGGYSCKCLPGYSYFPDKNKCKKEEAAYGGVLVIIAVITDTSKIAPCLQTFLQNIYESGNVTVTLVEIVEIVPFQALNAKSRRRRSSNQNVPIWNASFVIHTSVSIPTDVVKTILSDALGKLTSADDYADIGSRIPILVSLSKSSVYTDDQQGICEIPDKIDCDLVSTTCESANGSYSCNCKTPFFEGWQNPKTSCKDVDECEKIVCEGGTCSNYPGGYTCKCSAGFNYDGSRTCTDLCETNPCQNGGKCTHGDLEGQYLCKCDDKWTGPNCENKNEEAEKLKIIAIAVGASVGAVCLLLLFAIFGMYRRQKNKYSGYRKHLSTDFDSAYGLTRSDIRTKDFPIDDDTDTAFSIPRPRYNQSGYDSLGIRDDASYNGIEASESGKIEEPRTPLTKEARELKAGGNDNPSFLHSQSLEESRRTSKRESKNAYEYF